VGVLGGRECHQHLHRGGFGAQPVARLAVTGMYPVAADSASKRSLTMKVLRSQKFAMHLGQKLLASQLAVKNRLW